VIVEVFLLALATAVRPTSVAAVYAILAHDARTRLMIGYVAGGLAFTLAFGLLIVGVAHGIHVKGGTSETKGIVEIACGVVALVFGLGVLTGRLSGPALDDTPKPHGRMRSALDRRLTTRTAVIAGPATHIPGLFYLIALNLIVAHDAATSTNLFALLTYNAVWFALPLAALVLCVVRPEMARRLVGAVGQWSRDHTRDILLATSFVVGIALVIRGVLAL
jgi:hypothetical protein